MSEFKDLGLSAPVLEVLTELGFEHPTEIQEKAIPLLMEQESGDFIGLAQTGTGKTAAFGLPLIEKVRTEDSHPQALVMAPTRELGQQTAKQLEAFSANDRKLNVVCVYGGANISTQIKALKKPTQVVVATPGRLLDLIRRKAIRLDRVEYVVLDEADEMLNMGFKEDIDQILGTIEGEKSTWLFSATMPKDIRRIVKRYMDDPREVSVITQDRTNKDITHQFIMTKTSDKIPALRRFLDIQPDMRGVMFCRTRRDTQQIADELGELGYGVEALHGDLSQGQRDAVMKRFKNRSMQLLVATDVAARGIDVNDLTHVIHHRLPDQLESYTHRSGRTARAGKKGISIAFINSREQRKIRDLEKRLDVSFEKVEVPKIEEIRAVRMTNWAKNILRIEHDERAIKIREELSAVVGHLSQEQLLELLISAELKNLSDEAGGDLNLKQGKEQREERTNSTQNRYFINVGRMDDFNEKGLIRFLSEISNVKRNNFTDFSLQKNCAYFNIPKTQDKGFAAKFAGVDFDGREIRVNRDDDGARPPRQGGKGRKFHKKKFAAAEKRKGKKGHRGKKSQKKGGYSKKRK